MRDFARQSLKLVNSILNRAALLLLLFLLGISLYSLWDNHQIYESVDQVRSDLYKWRPTLTDGGDGDGGDAVVLDFSALKTINPDACAWLTIEGTNIDYPVMRGENNEVYLNRDVYGQFSLAGSVYLDSRNSPDFSDAGSLIYGHHMDRHLMFGDLDLFLDEDFFNADRSITLLTENGVHELSPLAVLQVSAGDRTIFELPEWDGDPEELLRLIREQGIHVSAYNMEIISSDPTVIQVVVLVTCASGHTNNRTILITIMPREEPAPDEPGTDVLPDEPPTPDDPPASGEVPGENDIPDELPDPDVPSGGLQPENTSAPGDEDELEELPDPDVPNGGLRPEDEWSAPAKTGDPFYHTLLFWGGLFVCAVMVLICTILYDRRKHRSKHK